MNHEVATTERPPAGSVCWSWPFRPFFLAVGVAGAVLVPLWLGVLFGWLEWPASVWLHAVGAGAMGTLILGVMTRVALGHTGRALRLPPGAVSIYWAVLAAGLLRLVTAAGTLQPRLGLPAAGAAWTLAFVLFLYFYTPILLRPRADGRPG